MLATCCYGMSLKWVAEIFWNSLYIFVLLVVAGRYVIIQSTLRKVTGRLQSFCTTCSPTPRMQSTFRRTWFCWQRLVAEVQYSTSRRNQCVRTCCVRYFFARRWHLLNYIFDTCYEQLGSHSGITIKLPRPPLAAVSGAHRFQVSRACLSMSTRSHSSQPIWLLPTCCLFQPSTTSFIVIIAATDSTNTTHNCRRPSFSSRQ